MIPDWKTNCVCFSGLLPERHPKLWQQLSEILRSRRIPVRLLDNTRDVWAKDYCPLQVEPRRFVKFRYYPDYLRYGHKRLITGHAVCRQFEDVGVCRRSMLILDGGNVVAAKNRVILTEKVYQENPNHERSGLRSKLAKLFQVSECIMIPSEKGDVICHSDGVVRFLDENLVVINDYARVDPDYGRRVCGILAKQGLRITRLPYFQENRSQDGIPSAVGNYVNFLRIGNLIVVPAYGVRQDQMACKKLKQFCPKATVVSLECVDLARTGGILNCVAATIQRSTRGARA